MNRPLPIVFGCGLIILGLMFAWFRHTRLHIPLIPNRSAQVWELELGISARSEDKPVRLSVFNPSSRNFFRIVDRAYTSDGYSISFTKIDNRSTLDFSKDLVDRAKQYFSVRMKVEKYPNRPQRKLAYRAGPQFKGSEHRLIQSLKAEARKKASEGQLTREIVSAIMQASGPDYTFLDSRRRRMDALHMLGIETRTYFGFPLVEGSRVQKLSTYIVAVDGDREIIYSVRDERFVNKTSVFLWGTSREPVEDARGLSELNWSVFMVPVEARIPKSVRKEKGVVTDMLSWFSLERLNLKTQKSFGVLLMLPLACLIVSVLRNVVGIKTFGTFMPAILALAIRETGIVLGVFLFVLVILLGVLLRIGFRYFRLLLVPRLSATLTCVVLLLFTLSLIGADLHKPALSSISLFPVVILSMAIERLSIAIEEHGYFIALTTTLTSLIAAVLCYLVVTQRWMAYLFPVFPELSISVLGASILLGRYFGFRLTEMFRFRAFAGADRNPKP